MGKQGRPLRPLDDDGRDGVGTTRRVELKTQISNHASPVMINVGWDAADSEWSPAERLRPVGPSLTGRVEYHELESGTVSIYGQKPVALLLADLNDESRDAAKRVLFIVGEDSLHEGMP